MAVEQIFKVACAICEKYENRDLAHDGHEIWRLSGDCLKQLINPFNRHPLAVRMTDCMVNYYCEQFRAENGAA